VNLVIYLPAFNEAATIGQVLDGIPASFPGISRVQAVVIDDGSVDGTDAIAKRHGAAVVTHAQNSGTGRAFVSGVTAALAARADIIVSLDADGQFRGSDIGALIAPIVNGKADIVLCTRFGSSQLLGRMPAAKRAGNWMLSKALSLIAGRTFSDVSCGFRAFTRDAAIRADVHSDYEYIHESLLNWSRLGMRITEIALPVLAERPVGESRIMRSVVRYAVRSLPVLVRAIRDYSPLKFFGFLALSAFVVSFALGSGVFAHWLRTGETIPYTSFIPVSVGGVLLSFLLGTLALVADLIARLRCEVEELLYESRKRRSAAESERRDAAA
jgi:glycosyltransferase involved in cell wall biosynthesis